MRVRIGLYIGTAARSDTDPRGGLADYLAHAGGPRTYEVRETGFTDLAEVNGRPAAEARFRRVGEGRDVQVAVCVVAVPDGLVLLRTNAGRVDRPPVRPAYELAKRTLAPA